MAVAFGGLRIVAAEGVQAVSVHLLRDRDFGVGAGRGFHHGDGVKGDGRGGHTLIQQGVHEGGVGAVLQQAAHQIGQQFFMAADGRIGADDDALALPGLHSGVV
jgi:hypothetical protein